MFRLKIQIKRFQTINLKFAIQFIKVVTVEKFFELFLEELKQNKNFDSYYKFHGDQGSFGFRKAYFIQRLQYIADSLKNASKEEQILDIGCGYATTAIFLVLNGYKVHGTTLEFYYKHIPERLKYWEKFGDVSGLSVSYENLFDSPPKNNTYNNIIIQDTLHHLEPLQDALKLIHDALKVGGKIIAIEENGNNVIQNAKLYKQRGNNKIITIYDETFKKEILIGNENIRSLAKWKSELEKQHLSIDNNSVQYIRYYFPRHYKTKSIEAVIAKEQRIWKQNHLLKEYFFFGINYLAYKLK